jgi:hypothetical protein
MNSTRSRQTQQRVWHGFLLLSTLHAWQQPHCMSACLLPDIGDCTENYNLNSAATRAGGEGINSGGCRKADMQCGLLPCMQGGKQKKPVPDTLLGLS